jgi:O-antigen ligase
MIAALKDRPLVGLGLGGWWPMVSGPHNAYLELYSDTGVLGVIAFILAAVISVRLCRQILSSYRLSPYYGIAVGAIAGIIAGGAHAFVDMNFSVFTPSEGNYLYFCVPLLWLWAALLVVSCHHLRDDTTGGKK